MTYLDAGPWKLTAPYEVKTGKRADRPRTPEGTASPPGRLQLGSRSFNKDETRSPRCHKATNWPPASDLVLHNVNSGAFEVYDIAGNTPVGAASLGAVGLDWQLAGFAVDPQTGATGNSDGSTSQLAQAMAGFGGSSGAADSLNAAPLSADTSQQTFLTTPQHT